MKNEHELEKQVLKNEANIPEEDLQEYNLMVTRDRIDSIRNVLNIYQEALERHEKEAMREEPTPSRMERTFGHLRNMAQALAELHDGHGDLRVRKRVHKKMYPPPEGPDLIKAKRTKREKLTAEQFEARITERINSEKDQLREEYMTERNALLSELKEATTESEKQPLKSRLNDCESRYAHAYSQFRDGSRENKIRAEETAKDKAIRERRNPPRPSQISQQPAAQQPKRKSGPSQIDLALRYYDRIDREKRAQERTFEDLAVQVRSHPFKTYDVKDERQYQTSGVPNRRAKRKF